MLVDVSKPMHQTRTDTIPAMWFRPLFGWMDVEMFSAVGDERERPAAASHTL
jgi:hypothetical protein